MEELFAPRETDSRRPTARMPGDLTRRLATASSTRNVHTAPTLPWTAASNGDRRLERQLRVGILRVGILLEGAFTGGNAASSATTVGLGRVTPVGDGQCGLCNHARVTPGSGMTTLAGVYGRRLEDNNL
jgi:hypothetical protein